MIYRLENNFHKYTLYENYFQALLKGEAGTSLTVTNLLLTKIT
jgi:hypothetical protein